MQFYWRCIAETHILLTELSVPELVRHFRQDKSLWRVDLGQTLSRPGCSHKVGSSGECQRLKSEYLLKFKCLAFYFDNQLFLKRTKLSEASRLTILSFTVDSFELFISSFSSTLSVWYGRNLRVRLSTRCPRYTVYSQWVDTIGEDNLTNSPIQLLLIRRIRTYEQIADFLFPDFILLTPYELCQRSFLSPLNSYIDEFNLSILDKISFVTGKYSTI